MKIGHLFQPNNPLFWLMLMVNALSGVLLWWWQHWPLSLAGAWLVGSMLVCNALLGAWLVWRLAASDRDASPAKP